MKRWTILVVALVCLTLLSMSCGSNGGDENSTDSTTSATDLVSEEMDWRPQDYYDSQGISDVSYDSERNSLTLTCNLKGQHAQLSSGEIVLDLKYVPTVESHVP
jgi:hypothetical protein